MKPPLLRHLAAREGLPKSPFGESTGCFVEDMQELLGGLPSNPPASSARKVGGCSLSYPKESSNRGTSKVKKILQHRVWIQVVSEPEASLP